MPRIESIIGAALAIALRMDTAMKTVRTKVSDLDLDILGDRAVILSANARSQR